ncbi:hypothetical protein R3P38DRAFT_2785017 [Favolaschia claudopus]|uniref:Uncharacterized protein n=1 Tax=Favolaschia claudopus TaxID=2862362 RepID=A0AAW0AVY9_9AGAR
MPFPRLFKRNRTTGVVDAEDTSLAAGLSTFNRLVLTVPIPELRHTASMPHLRTPTQTGPPPDSPNAAHDKSSSLDGKLPAASQLNVSITCDNGDDTKALLPTPASPQVSRTPSELPDHAASQLKISITGDNEDDMKELSNCMV